MKTLEKVVRGTESRLDYSDNVWVYIVHDIRGNRPAKNKEPMGAIGWNGVQSYCIDPESVVLFNHSLLYFINFGDSLVKQTMWPTWPSPCLITNVSLYIPCSVFELPKLRTASHEFWRVCEETTLWCIV